MPRIESASVGVIGLGKGLATAIMSLFLPSFILLYNWSPDTGGSLLVIQMFGVFYVFAFYSSSLGGTSSDGTGFRLFDLNWYLDLDKYFSNLSFSSNQETAAAEAYADHGIFVLYGNYEEVVTGNSANIALGIPGMLMAVFLLFLLAGIIVNLIGSQKGSGILFIFAGIAVFGALILSWSMLYGLDTIGSAFTGAPSEFANAPGDKYVPIPFGAILVLLAGLRAMIAKEEPK
ncbi:MAG: hypothetical protein ACFFGZ_00180 [Candidatus Thorarchaeota archaeon]